DRRSGHSRQHHEQQRGNDERAAPHPIFNYPWMTLPAREIQPELTKRTQISVEEETGRATERGPKHENAEPNTRQAVNVINQARRKQRMQLRQKDNLPCVALHCSF